MPWGCDLCRFIQRAAHICVYALQHIQQSGAATYVAVACTRPGALVHIQQTLWLSACSGRAPNGQVREERTLGSHILLRAEL